MYITKITPFSSLQVGEIFAHGFGWENPKHFSILEKTSDTEATLLATECEDDFGNEDNGVPGKKYRYKKVIYLKGSEEEWVSEGFRSRYKDWLKTPLCLLGNAICSLPKDVQQLWTTT